MRSEHYAVLAVLLRNVGVLQVFHVGSNGCVVLGVNVLGRGIPLGHRHYDLVDFLLVFNCVFKELIMPF